MSSHLCSDATYKLVWQGFPVLIIGTTDLNKAFHPFGLAIYLLKPTALICDAADSIKNGLKNVFGNSYNQIMCWAHMKRIVENQPTISLKLWTSSYQWAKLIKDIVCIPNVSSKKYYIPARDLQSITQATLDKYENKKWTTFNQFKKSFDIWCMEMENGSDWKISKCNCPDFLKNYICKHAVGMAIRLKYCKPPAAAKTVPIGEKRKRGRPAKAKPALLVQ
ncbi:unnamed protein product [Rotaria sp. Silwood2]|nr:unnamed protein product [Rotaria sp. Silwood2]